MPPQPSTLDTTPVVVAARRTPIGTAGRALAHVRADDLAAPVLRALADDLTRLAYGNADDHAGGPPDPSGGVVVDDVVLGSSQGPDGALARVAALRAGLGQGVPGMTVDRQCAGGLAAVTTAAAMVAAGQATVVLAGGVESASSAPPGRARFAPAGHGDPDMGVAAETVSREAGISRERQDAYAARSHARALEAAHAGRFDDEIVAVAGLHTDERPRPLTVQRLARLPAAFVPGGTVTAGNSCGVNDGAAAVAVVPEWWRARHHVPGLRLRGTATAGVDPARCGLGLVPATQTALVRAGASADDLGSIEVVEAFAGQVLAGLDTLGIDEHLACPDGGALALGHPWGASGAVVLVRLFSRLVRQGAVDPQRPYAAAAVAAGGGQGVAVVVEPVRMR
jgi:acetyl-CoA C-acetyltransferase